MAHADVSEATPVLTIIRVCGAWLHTLLERQHNTDVVVHNQYIHTSMSALNTMKLSACYKTLKMAL
jgi:hypothetical protein